MRSTRRIVERLNRKPWKKADVPSAQTPSPWIDGKDLRKNKSTFDERSANHTAAENHHVLPR